MLSAKISWLLATCLISTATLALRLAKRLVVAAPVERL
jgi:hypothetical protein